MILPVAIDEVARHLIGRVLDQIPEGEWWGSYPDIGEHDWEAIEERAMGYLRPSVYKFDEAYAWLKTRAERNNERGFDHE